MRNSVVRLPTRYSSHCAQYCTKQARRAESAASFGHNRVTHCPCQTHRYNDRNPTSIVFLRKGTHVAKGRYEEASIRVLKGLEPVKERPGMYTRTTDPTHIIQEVIDNAADEALGEYATHIDVTVHAD